MKRLHAFITHITSKGELLPIGGMTPVEGAPVRPKARFVTLHAVMVMARFTEVRGPVAVPNGYAAAVPAFVLNISVSMLFTDGLSRALA